MIRCFQRVSVICRSHLAETVRVAVVIGTVLFTINQLDVVLAAKATWVTRLKAALTYLVPFPVATTGCWSAAGGGMKPPRPRTGDRVSRVTGRSTDCPLVRAGGVRADAAPLPKTGLAGSKEARRNTCDVKDLTVGGVRRGGLTFDELWNW
jgi:hypothetical protein